MQSRKIISVLIAIALILSCITTGLAADTSIVNNGAGIIINNDDNQEVEETDSIVIDDGSSSNSLGDMPNNNNDTKDDAIIINNDVGEVERDDYNSKDEVSDSIEYSIYPEITKPEWDSILVHINNSFESGEDLTRESFINGLFAGIGRVLENIPAEEMLKGNGGWIEAGIIENDISIDDITLGSLLYYGNNIDEITDVAIYVGEGNIVYYGEYIDELGNEVVGIIKQDDVNEVRSGEGYAQLVAIAETPLAKEGVLTIVDMEDHIQDSDNGEDFFVISENGIIKGIVSSKGNEGVDIGLDEGEYKVSKVGSKDKQDIAIDSFGNGVVVFGGQDGETKSITIDNNDNNIEIIGNTGENKASVFYRYYDSGDNYFNYDVIANAEFQTKQIVKEDGLHIRVNNYIGDVSIDTNPNNLYVILNYGAFDESEIQYEWVEKDFPDEINETISITSKARYDSSTGDIILPLEYAGYNISILIYKPENDVTYLNTVLNVDLDGERSLVLKGELLSSDISIPAHIYNNGKQIKGVEAYQNGMPIYNVIYKNDNILIPTTPLGGSVDVDIKYSESTIVDPDHDSYISDLYRVSGPGAVGTRGRLAGIKDPFGCQNGPISIPVDQATGEPLTIIAMEGTNKNKPVNQGPAFGWPEHDNDYGFFIAIRHDPFNNGDHIISGIRRGSGQPYYTTDGDYAEGNTACWLWGTCAGDVGSNGTGFSIATSCTIDLLSYDAATGTYNYHIFITTRNNKSGAKNQSINSYFSYQLPTGTLDLRKVSSVPEKTNGDPNFKFTGATFAIYDMNGNQVGTTSCDATGKCSPIDLDAGTYKISEIVVPSGFIKGADQNITITPGETTTFSFPNAPGKGYVKMRKASANPDKTYTDQYNLANTKYNVINSAGAVVGTFTMKADGTSQPDSLLLSIGNYTIKEVQAGKGYELSKDTLNVTVNGAETVTVNHKDKGVTGGISVKKISSRPDISDGCDGYTLAGAVFEIKSKKNPEKFTKRITTDANGNASISDIPLDTYVVTEIAPPKGFELPTDGSQTTEVTLTAQNPNASPVNYKALTFSDYPQFDPILVILEKVDKDLNVVPQGDGKLQWATYNIEYYKELFYNIVDKPEKAERSWIAVTDERGVIDIRDADLFIGDDELYRYTDPITGEQMIAFPLGTLVVEEVLPPEGYNLSPQSYVIPIESAGVDRVVHTYVTPIDPEDIERGGIKIEKWDIEKNKRDPQGDATLVGAQFEIINRSDNPVVVKDITYARGEVCLTITTNTQGVAESGIVLPYGTYDIREKKEPNGYLNEGVLQQRFEIRAQDEVVVYDADNNVIKNKPIRGGFYLEKWDNEINANQAQGGATLGGAMFELYNKSQNSVLVKNSEGALVEYQPNQMIETFMTDKDGHILTADDYLPYGTYYIKEVAPPEGYLKTGDKLDHTFTIRENGVIVHIDEDATAIKNYPKRGDFEATKIGDGSMQRMGNVPFKITSKTTGESHILYTDDNGQMSTHSDWTPHSQNTNAGTMHTDGIWFGDPSTVDDSLGALPYDSYTIQEMPCEANKGFKLIKTDFRVYRHNQTVHFGTLTDDATADIEIFTNAVDKETGESVGFVNTKTQIVDTVTYSGVTPRAEYKLKGILVDTETGDNITNDAGTSVTGETTFIPKTADGTVQVVFTFDTTSLAGKEVTVFEYLVSTDDEDDIIAKHEDIGDTFQTVKFEEPEVQTTATSQDGEKEVEANTETTIVDRVEYKNLIVGKSYTVSGKLMDKLTGEVVVDKNNKPVTSQVTFVAEESDGYIDMIFTFDAINYANKPIVVFEDLEYGGRVIASHRVIEDEGQTVTTKGSSIGTLATGVGGDKVVYASDETVLIDKVSYEGLTPGVEYTLSGVLMDKETGEPIHINGVPVKSSATFTPEEEDGEVAVTFVFNGLSVVNRDLVVFETLTKKTDAGDVEVANHKDIEDEGQTIKPTPITIGTTATGEDGSKEIEADKNVIIKDTIDYNGLTVGEEYELKGVLMDKATGLPLLLNGKQIESSTKFTAESVSGSVDVEFTLDTSNLEGVDIVVFEELIHGKVVISEHKDLTSASQTVRVKKIPKEFIELRSVNPKIGTNASGVDGSKTIASAPNTQIIDRIDYSGLTVGETYELRGVLMDKATGGKLLVGGQEVTASATFKAESASGYLDVTFTLDTSNLAGAGIVVFEELLHNGEVIAEHKDINDTAQTVMVKQPQTPQEYVPVQTGGNPLWIVMLIIAISSGAMLGYLMLKEKRLRKHTKQG